MKSHVQTVTSTFSGLSHPSFLSDTGTAMCKKVTCCESCAKTSCRMERMPFHSLRLIVYMIVVICFYRQITARKCFAASASLKLIVYMIVVICFYRQITARKCSAASLRLIVYMIVVICFYRQITARKCSAASLRLIVYMIVVICFYRQITARRFSAASSGAEKNVFKITWFCCIFRVEKNVFKITWFCLNKC
ncbi:unnamed protein product [Candidula unifasciata]|uniref:Uncharacterized protein n=1 Tax=Candidula unifasciata TaxID=100452 RepID=A0A8S3Z3C4_9EUPU|nr:unnamed protein product [Candidula unifasciata]